MPQGCGKAAFFVCYNTKTNRFFMNKQALFVFALGGLYAFSAAAAEPEAAWLALGHYRPGLLGGYEGSIDSPGFYLAANGRTDPEAELKASIELFAEGTDKEKICLFPARYKYLLNKGLIEPVNIECEEFAGFKEDLQPAGVTLLFTDAYMNSPSSLFGHTLLRIDTARKGTQMIAHGANYGAYTDGENGVLYAVYGLTGGYYGGWTVKPYYNIINTYNNIENRDIWELNLDFSAEELDMFVAHLWEIGHTQTRYYFFTKNCSYMLMEALDAVRPELRLADKFPLQTIPLDTFKAVYRAPGLVKGVNYRPSRQAKIVHRLQQMNRGQKKALLAAVQENDYTLAELPEGEKADVLETAYQYVQYQLVKKDLPLPEYRRRSFALLTARNRLADAKAKISENPEGRSPLEAHEAMRATVGVGNRNGESFQEISYRPAYHSLTDNNYGLLPGAEINFLNFKIRHYDESKKTVLSRFDLLGIRSLSPVDSLFAPVSFAISLNVARELNPVNDKEGYAANVKVGGGGTVALGRSMYAYVAGNAYASYGGFLPHGQYLGFGAAAGLFVDFSRFKLLAEAEKVFATTWYGNKIKYRLEANIPLTTNVGLAAEYAYDDNSKGRDEEEFVSSLRFYF